MNLNIKLALAFVVCLFLGMVLIDISHVISPVYYDHNLYVAYFLIGLSLGMIATHCFGAEKTCI